LREFLFKYNRFIKLSFLQINAQSTHSLLQREKVAAQPTDEVLFVSLIRSSPLTQSTHFKPSPAGEGGGAADG
jgi:hypothetical protein